MNGFCNQAARRLTEKSKHPINPSDEDKDNLGNTISQVFGDILEATDVVDVTMSLGSLLLNIIDFSNDKGINLDPILEIFMDSERFGWDEKQIKQRIDYALRNQTVDGSFH